MSASPAPGVYTDAAAAAILGEPERKTRFELSRELRHSLEGGPSPAALRRTPSPAVALPSSGAPGAAPAERLSAAERALRRLQRENDALKHTEVRLRQERRALRETVAALRREVEMLGATVLRQTVALRTAGDELRRQDPRALARDRHTQPERAATTPSPLSPQPESIMLDDDDRGGGGGDAADDEPARMIRALERLSFMLQRPSDERFALRRSRSRDSRRPDPAEPLYTVDAWALSCLSLVDPQAPATPGKSSGGHDHPRRPRLNPYVVLRGPHGQQCSTAPQRRTDCPSYADTHQEGSHLFFHALRRTAQLVHAEVWSRVRGGGRGDILLGTASLPVAAVVEHFRATERRRRRQQQRTGESDGADTPALHSVPLTPPAAAEGRAAGPLCAGSITIAVRVSVPGGADVDALLRCTSSSSHSSSDSSESSASSGGSDSSHGSDGSSDACTSSKASERTPRKGSSSVRGRSRTPPPLVRKNTARGVGKQHATPDSARTNHKAADNDAAPPKQEEHKSNPGTTAAPQQDSASGVPPPPLAAVPPPPAAAAAQPLPPPAAATPAGIPPPPVVAVPPPPPSATSGIPPPPLVSVPSPPPSALSQ